MTIIIPLPSIIAGLLAGLLYVALHHGWIVGITAPFLPVFVLALSGMRYGRAGISVACFSAIPIIISTLPFYDAAFILLVQLMPLALFIRTLMMAIWIAQPPIAIWTPVGLAMGVLATYGAGVFFLLITVGDGLYAHIITTMQATIAESFTTLEPEMAAMMETLMKGIPHLLVAIDFCIWTVMMFVVVALANTALHSMGQGRRPHVRLMLHNPPNWVLAGLAIAFVLSVIAPTGMQQGAQAASIILLLPYFFSGLSYVHTRLHELPRSAVWMAGFYLLFIVLSLWPVVFVTLYGMVRHVGHCSFFDRRTPRT
jgi:hypothetical protein